MIDNKPSSLNPVSANPYVKYDVWSSALPRNLTSTSNSDAFKAVSNHSSSDILSDLQTVSSRALAFLSAGKVIYIEITSYSHYRILLIESGHNTLIQRRVNMPRYSYRKFNATRKRSGVGSTANKVTNFLWPSSHWFCHQSYLFNSYRR